jgi:hypothetical protein
MSTNDITELEVENSHEVATITLTEADLVDERLQMPSQFAAELANAEVVTVDMIDTSGRRERHTLRSLRNGLQLLGLDWPPELRAGQRVELITLRGSQRIGAYYSTV